MPRGQYHTDTHIQWTPERIRAAAVAFQARTGRLPRVPEWRSVYGLPDQRTVQRVLGSLEAAVEGITVDASRQGRAKAPWHFGAGRQRREGD